MSYPQRITEQHWSDETVPLLTIFCITYNHVHFIRQAIDGFLMQETTFPIEILIHDDASTDGTADIVREYEVKYPQLIKAIYQTENQYSKGNKSGHFLRPLQQAKYIAYCEGDDYWTDPKKLEIQVSYLEKHPECVISGHDEISIDEQGHNISSAIVPPTYKRDYTASEIQELGWTMMMPLTWVYRNVLPLEPIPEWIHIKNEDSFIISLLGQFGGSKYHTEISPACYRHHQGGIWSMQPDDLKREDQINTYFWMYRYYKRIGNQHLAHRWKSNWQYTVIEGMQATFLITELGKRFFLIRPLIRWIRGILGPERVRTIKQKVGWS